MLAAISKQWVRGAKVEEDRIHPFRNYFEELQPGDSLLTPRRTNDRGRYCELCLPQRRSFLCTYG